MKARRTKKVQGRVYELVSWEEVLEKELAGENEEAWIDREWEDRVAWALDTEAEYNYMDYDSPLEVEHNRILYRGY